MYTYVPPFFGMGETFLNSNTGNFYIFCEKRFDDFINPEYPGDVLFSFALWFPEVYPFFFLFFVNNCFFFQSSIGNVDDIFTYVTNEITDTLDGQVKRIFFLSS